VSYGIAANLLTSPLVRANAGVKVRVPTSGNLGTSWLAAGFNDNSWTSGFTGVGYDADTAPPRISGWTMRMVNFNEDINSIGTATRLLNGDFSGYTVNQPLPAPRDYLTINHGAGGDYGGDQALPDGSQSNETYALRATSDVFFPAGTWTINVGSDDGFMLSILSSTTQVSFTSRTNQNTAGVPLPQAGNTLVYSAPRGHGAGTGTFGTFTIPAGGLNVRVQLDYYENGGGDDVEVSIAPGTQAAFNAGVFKLLADGVEPGLTVKTTSSTPPPDFNPVISANVGSAMRNVNPSAYVRVALGEVLDPNDFDSLKLRMKYDDGFVAYLNGVKIAERNAPASPVWNSVATAVRNDAEALVYEDILIDLPPGLLQSGLGNNVLAAPRNPGHAIAGLSRSVLAGFASRVTAGSLSATGALVRPAGTRAAPRATPRSLVAGAPAGTAGAAAGGLLLSAVVPTAVGCGCGVGSLARGSSPFAMRRSSAVGVQRHASCAPDSPMIPSVRMSVHTPHPIRIASTIVTRRTPSPR
jgi:hypothetical protein